LRHVALAGVDSTNAEARRMAEAGDRGPVWISAARQTAGRGRRGRGWLQEPGDLAATLLLPGDGLDAATAAQTSFCACLATAELLDALAPGAEVALKWPNDPLLNGAKVAGVLLESAGDGGRLRWLAIGIGVNLASAPPPEPDAWPPISVAAVTGAAPDPATALTILATRLDAWLTLWRAEGFAPVRRAWTARAARLGAPITVRLPRQTLQGVFESLDEDGALVLSQPQGRRRIHAADVYFA
jgi:BirA family biotin operon repressor/biotin-[acetyl-CoA-carboxylase] ligase